VNELSSYVFSALREADITLYRGSCNGLSRSRIQSFAGHPRVAISAGCSKEIPATRCRDVQMIAELKLWSRNAAQIARPSSAKDRADEARAFARGQMDVQNAHRLQLIAASCSTDKPPRTGRRRHRLRHSPHTRRPNGRRHAGSRGLGRREYGSRQRAHGSHQHAHGSRLRRSDRRRSGHHQSDRHLRDRRLRDRRLRHEQRLLSGLQNHPEG
jgi:hypothetical protein